MGQIMGYQAEKGTSISWVLVFCMKWQGQAKANDYKKIKRRNKENTFNI